MPVPPSKLEGSRWYYQQVAGWEPRQCDSYVLTEGQNLQAGRHVVGYVEV
jgi:hypothetical protein